ncbi:GNAT family N-acetyltransferase [Jeotgalibacillus sp. R-1-5s-1]|uniref:GNAT family N-acetyltransferase n=1 Tax=Jeotgalibacillus sp. R-1-5s-1 TaxID=2555897 RepID=UPI00106A8A66|nr:GNAT family N-acetyltransferase [Jeotgalibacillus sp. R-1-5s-1]TFD94442.1 GNAT family N-acetyltransferase [Jeotgalibacillus sp. R-1-5s-1]
MNIRPAQPQDIPQLIKMRWDFTIEHDETGKVKDTSYQVFEKECRAFLESAIEGQKWWIWVAEEEGKVLSHIYTELVEKVPRPGRVTYPFVFMTNVYTLPDYRGKGIGSQLLKAIHEWVKEHRYEFVIVWPSEDSVDYYERNDYNRATEPMEYFPES